ncbi:MAG: AMP-binding protein, partial [Aeromicrobium sp.]|nr:AMP-binding protein [Burkholderiales bacterium]
GLRNYSQPALMAYEQLTALGREFNANNATYFRDQIAEGKPDDIAVMLYTSGTTGKAKGVSHTHAALIHTANVLVDFDGITENDNVLCYLPMAWVGDFLYSYGQSYVTGLCLNCPESTDTVMECLREIGPTYYFAPPRVYENILTQVMIRIEDGTPLKRWMFHYFMDIARRVGIRVLDGKKDVSLIDRLLYGLGELLVYGPMKNVLGLSRIRVAYSGGEAIGPDLFNFYRSMGINLKQLYGMTETCVTVCMQKSGDVKLGTVGAPMPGVEVRLSADSEVLVRSKGMMKEYHRQPGASKSAINAEGFFLTGDAGFFDTDGHPIIIDRAKDVGRLADGSLFAPKYIENKLKFFPYVKEAVAFGDGRDQVTAMINIGVAAIGDWAERRNLVYAGYADLAAKTEVYAPIADCVGKVNADLAADPKLATSQISRFVILHKELDADDGELTRTRKVRRNTITEKYAVIVDALFSTVDHCEIEAAMKFEDGRSGVVRADLRIGVAKTSASNQAATVARKAA